MSKNPEATMKESFWGYVTHSYDFVLNYIANTTLIPQHATNLKPHTYHTKHHTHLITAHAPQTTFYASI